MCCQGFMQDNNFTSHTFLVDMWMLNRVYTVWVVPLFSGHSCIQAKVSLHCRCPLIGGTEFFSRCFWLYTLNHYYTVYHREVCNHKCE